MSRLERGAHRRLGDDSPMSENSEVGDRIEDDSYRVTTEEVPAGFEFVRTTPTFDNVSVPAGLLGTHHVARGAWGRLLVHSGELAFVFEDFPDTPISVGAGRYVVIPPERPHHLELDGPATFAVEFYRRISA